MIFPNILFFSFALLPIVTHSAPTAIVLPPTPQTLRECGTSSFVDLDAEAQVSVLFPLAFLLFTIE